jgi:hypothetical protein
LTFFLIRSIHIFTGGSFVCRGVSGPCTVPWKGKDHEAGTKIAVFGIAKKDKKEAERLVSLVDCNI